MKERKKTPCDVIELSNSYINNSLAIFLSYFILFLFFTPFFFLSSVTFPRQFLNYFMFSFPEQESIFMGLKA